jgi:hypothetical protein
MHKTKEPSCLDSAIEDCLAELRGYDADSPEYSKILKQLTKLYALKALDRPERISKDTIAIVLGNLAVAIIIVGHEQAHVVTSKVLGFLVKHPRF